MSRPLATNRAGIVTAETLLRAEAALATGQPPPHKHRWGRWHPCQCDRVIEISLGRRPGHLGGPGHALLRQCQTCSVAEERLPGALWRSPWSPDYPPPVRSPQTGTEQCGTPRGYYRHLRHGEPTCPACREVIAAERRRQLRQRRQAVTP